MAYPLLENPLGNKFYFDGSFIDSVSKEAEDLKVPTDAVTYYETIRIKDGILLFIVDHLSRLSKSVQGIENFPVDIDDLSFKCYEFLKNIDFDYSDCNLRLVLTKDHLLIHLCEANIPTTECFTNGVNSLVLNWERVDPNLKVFRGDYKSAVADKFKSVNSFGNPYEVLLSDSNGKLYEGSKSNLFVIIGNDVYSAPDDKILLGITRNRVIESMNKAGGTLKIGTFTLDEIMKHKDSAVFVSSTPFDILPIAHIDEYNIDSANNMLLKRISEEYLKCTNEYIIEAKKKYY